jgi:hypothetical protein
VEQLPLRKVTPCFPSRDVAPRRLQHNTPDLGRALFNWTGARTVDRSIERTNERTNDPRDFDSSMDWLKVESSQGEEPSQDRPSGGSDRRNVDRRRPERR